MCKQIEVKSITTMQELTNPLITLVKVSKNHLAIRQAANLTGNIANKFIC